MFRIYGIGLENPAVPVPHDTAASNSCVRMYKNDIEDLFNYVAVGTVVTIFQYPIKKTGHTNNCIACLFT